MSSPTKSGTAQPPLVDEILQKGKPAFNPEVPEEERQSSIKEFTSLLDNTKTLTLMPVLNLLVQPGRVPPWLRTPLVSALARLPLRIRGVQDTIQFILSVHPSTANGAVPAGGRGAAISHEAMNAISRLIVSTPTGMLAEEWFNGIAPQLRSLLLGEGEPEMDRVAAYVIGFGILGRKQYGAPGTPGWNAFVEPIHAALDPSLAKPNIHAPQTSSEPVYIGPKGRARVLSSASQLSQSIRMLSALIFYHPHPSLAKRLLRPILLPLWALASWSEGNKYIDETYQQPARKLLGILLQLSSGAKQRDPDRNITPPNLLQIMTSNLSFRGNLSEGKILWKFVAIDDGGIQIEEISLSGSRTARQHDISHQSVDIIVNSFVELMEETSDITMDISGLFIDLCSRWLVPSSSAPTHSIRVRTDDATDTRNDTQRLIEAKVLQRMMTTIPDKLIHNSRQVLELVDEVFIDFVASSEKQSENEDVVAVALSLLNLILTSPGFKKTDESRPKLESIQKALETISKQSYLDISTTAGNLALLLRFHGSVAEPTDTPRENGNHQQQQDDRKAYSLAMSYLTAVDSPPPVRAQGLELLSDLVQRNSPIMDIPALLILFSSLLQDSEEYIYLRTIKSLIQLSHKHPKAVIRDLIERYVDSNEAFSLDQRLRLGEALLQALQENPVTFEGEVARTVCNGLLFVASRRGYRPKTQMERERAEKVKSESNKEAEKAWDGPVPQLDEVLEVESSAEGETLSQIVTGWEGKRGAEDLRMRTSATSILGSAIEVNIDGIGAETLSKGVDLAIHILTLEPDVEKGILRRAAILLIMSFIRALDAAREDGKKLPFGFVGQSLDDVRRILAYIESVDNDGLVRQHARDAIEGLRDWEINALSPVQREQSSLQHLAGLSLSSQIRREDNVRARIEEID